MLAGKPYWHQYEAAEGLTRCRWPGNNPGDNVAAAVRAALTCAPERHATCMRGYLGWGVFARIAR